MTYVEIPRQPTCPECAQGKHTNCGGDAWDNELDVPTVCGCYVETPALHTQGAP